MSARLPLLLPAVLAACAPRAPEDALARYREAVRTGDAAAIRALSDASFRAAFDEDAVKEALAEGPAEIPPARASEERARFALEGGGAIELVLEDGEWKVAGGGIEPARFDTPERALQAFFRAALAGRLSVVREAIPKRDRDALSTDALLLEHLAANADRITRARDRIGAITPGRAAVRGDRAELSYGPGLSVTFEKEGGAWRIVDLE